GQVQHAVGGDVQTAGEGAPTGPVQRPAAGDGLVARHAASAPVHGRAAGDGEVTGRDVDSIEVAADRVVAAERDAGQGQVCDRAALKGRTQNDRAADHLQSGNQIVHQGQGGAGQLD